MFVLHLNQAQATPMPPVVALVRGTRQAPIIVPKTNNKVMIKKAFTLIELLVVISIISILVAVGATSYQRAVKLSRDSKRKTDLEQIRQALETFRAESTTGVYPANKALLSPNYITVLPTDPKENGTTYTYRYTPGGSPIKTYNLCAITMEITTPTLYCVTQP